MASLAVLNVTGKKIEEYSLDTRVFDGRVHREAVRLSVVNHLANRRVGTASTKERGEVSGGGKKPWRQKGTGRARAGSIRSPLWRHGGVVFGPKPRDYHYEVPKKVRRLALQSSLNAKVQDQSVLLLDELAIKEPKTKHLAAILTSLDALENSLLVVDEISEPLRRASNNLPGVSVKTAKTVFAYDVIRSRKLVATKAGLDALTQRLLADLQHMSSSQTGEESSDA